VFNNRQIDEFWINHDIETVLGIAVTAVPIQTLAMLAAQGCNLMLLDEPINHLDIPARTRFEQALSGFQGTILAVVHDRYFLQGFARELWQVRCRGIQPMDLSFGEFPDLSAENE